MKKAMDPPVTVSMKENRCMPPPRKQLNPKAKNSGLQKPRLGGTRSRIAFKPRNGQLARVKNDAPFKAKVSKIVPFMFSNSRKFFTEHTH